MSWISKRDRRNKSSRRTSPRLKTKRAASKAKITLSKPANPKKSRVRCPWKITHPTTIRLARAHLRMTPHRPPWKISTTQASRRTRPQESWCHKAPCWSSKTSTKCKPTSSFSRKLQSRQALRTRMFWLRPTKTLNKRIKTSLMRRIARMTSS